MKTIKEAGLECANDFLLDYGGNRDEIEYWVGDVGFSSGVAWAERWIPVTESLPEYKVTILIKHNYRGREIISTAIRQEDEDGYEFYTTIDGKIIAYPYEVTHWRPIEHK